MDKAEHLLGKAGNYAKSLWHRATTKVNYKQLQRMWVKSKRPHDVDSIYNILINAGVDQKTATDLFTNMGLPAPASTAQQAGGTASMQNGASTQASATQAGASTQAGAPAGAQQQQQQATNDIRIDIDKLLQDLERVPNTIQQPYVDYIRKRLDMTYGAGGGSSVRTESAPKLSKEKYIEKIGSDKPTGEQMNESRKRMYGGKYIKESADNKLVREFEHFVKQLG